MITLRGITTLGLCLFLTLTSVTLAVARGAAGPVGMMVICTGEGTQRVSVDVDGQPVKPPHVCPDCLLAFHATAPSGLLPVPMPALSTARNPFAYARHATAAMRPAMHARAPPSSV